ncbi:MAG: AAA family ATPase [Gemmatimonadetes bacterium]|nr:AAA family ATPase [Gemmatimonadota bacterium]
MSDAPNREPPERMCLERFHVKHFRSLRDVEVMFEPDITVLIGRNDTGKTSLLEALAWYGEIVANGFRGVAQLRLGPSDVPPRLRANWRDERTGRQFEHSVWCYPPSPEEHLLVGGRHWRWSPLERRVSSLRGKEHVARGLGRLASLGSISLADWRSLTEVPDKVAEALATAGRFRVPSPYLLEPSALSLAVRVDADRVGGNGAGWAILLQDIINRRDGTLEELEGHVRALFPFFRRATVVEERWLVSREVVALDERSGRSGASGPLPGAAARSPEETLAARQVQCEVAAPASKPGPEHVAWVSAEAMSSGVLLALAYLTVAMSSPPGSLLLLEEPENGLNRVITLRMMERFLEVVRQRQHQLIMTTHNEFWLDLVGPERIRVVTRDDAGTHVSADPDNMRALQEEGFMLSEAMALGGPERLIEKRRGHV